MSTQCSLHTLQAGKASKDLIRGLGKERVLSRGIGFLQITCSPVSHLAPSSPSQCMCSLVSSELCNPRTTSGRPGLLLFRSKSLDKVGPLSWWTNIYSRNQNVLSGTKQCTEGAIFQPFAGGKSLLDVEDQEKTHLAKPEASAMLRVAFLPIPKFHNYPKSASKVPWPFQSNESSSNEGSPLNQQLELWQSSYLCLTGTL